MKSNYSQGRFGKAILAFSLMCGFALAASTNAQAQYGRGQRDDRSDQGRRNRDWQRNRDDRQRDRDERDERDERDDRNRDRDGDYRNGNDQYGRGNGQYGRGNGNNIYRAAQNQGYQAGLNTGASDAQRGQNYDPQRSHYYRNATDGYNSSYGNREAYKQAYRDGFTQGYQEGFRRYDGGGNGRNYPRSNRTGSILGGIFGRP